MMKLSLHGCLSRQTFIPLLAPLVLTMSFCLLNSTSSWAIEFPSDLNSEDRAEVLQTLGINTSSKLLSNPYPLGGYPGWEFGLTLEVINIEELSRLGSKTELQQEMRYPRISFGKGLYRDIDLFMHFTPYGENIDIKEFGGIFKWEFYRLKDLPIGFHLLAHGSNVNIKDTLTSQSIGLDLLVGINANNFSLYLGSGQVQTEGEFIASGPLSPVPVADPATSPSNTIRQLARSSHSFVGLNFKWDTFFIAAQLDRYQTPTYSVKVGVRL
jgi:hypothetical protein